MIAYLEWVTISPWTYAGVLRWVIDQMLCYHEPNLPIGDACLYLVLKGWSWNTFFYLILFEDSRRSFWPGWYQAPRQVPWILRGATNLRTGRHKNGFGAQQGTSEALPARYKACNSVYTSTFYHGCQECIQLRNGMLLDCVLCSRDQCYIHNVLSRPYRLQVCTYKQQEVTALDLVTYVARPWLPVCLH